MVPAPLFNTTLLAGPWVLVGPAAVMLRGSPSASLALRTIFETVRTRLPFAVTLAVVFVPVGGVLTTTLVAPAADVQPLTVAVT